MTLGQLDQPPAIGSAGFSLVCFANHGFTLTRGIMLLASICTSLSFIISSFLLFFFFSPTCVAPTPDGKAVIEIILLT